MTGQQISSALAILCPTVAPAFSFDGTTLTFTLWLDKTTGQPSTITQPTLAQLAAVVVPSPPDWLGFLKWIAETFDPPTVNRFASGYPEFNGYCQFGNAPYAQWCITNGKTKLAPDGLPVMSTTNYALFQQANMTYHLGMTLP